MTEKSANSGVRNLRAMFENQSATSSPEPRGRSPAGQTSADSDPPTSKVRASFVAVGPSAHITRDLGTTKGTVDGVNSPDANRRESFSVSEELGEDAVAELKRAVSNEKEARKNSDAIPETIPEQAVETRESSRNPPPIREAIREIEETMPNLGSIMKGSDFPESQPIVGEKVKAEEPIQASSAAKKEEAITQPAAAIEEDKPDTAVPKAKEEAPLKPVEPKKKASVSGGEAVPLPTKVLPPANGSKSVAQSSVPEPAVLEPAVPEPSVSEPVRAAVNTPTKTKASDVKATAATNGKTNAKKPAAISTSKDPITKAPSSKPSQPKSPAVARLPKTPTAPKATPSASSTKPPANAQGPAKPTDLKDKTKATAVKTSRSSLRSSLPPTAAGETTKPKAQPAAEKKAAPRASMAGSISKAAADGTTTSPGGFKKPRPKSPTRPVRLPSHLTAPTASSKAKHDDETTEKGAQKPTPASRPVVSKVAPVARKPASRSSLAPTTVPAKRPESRTSTRGAGDEGFLSRMMRPTTSSKSKTNDKPTSPPRRAASVRTAPKSAHEGAVAKGKRKVGEIAAKAKEAVSNGHQEEPSTKETHLADSKNEIPADAPAEAPQEHVSRGEENPSINQTEANVTELSTATPGSEAVH